MKKRISILCLFVLGLLMLPKLVLAEDLPREGVHYFLTYPDGSEVVTKSYEEATSQEEKLIYSGLTSSEGQVVLEGLLDEGSLRIVQKVPNGYTTDTTEVSLDLSQGKSPVEFVDYKGVNPKTGQSILFIVGIAAVVLVSFIVVKKDNKKLFIIPVLLLSGLLLHVNAENDNLVITVKDKNGNKLAGVEVEVYAKPVKVEAAPAITYDANGGKFLDGKDKMYFRLPSSPCSVDQFFNSLSDEEAIYLNNNGMLAQREGYAIDLDAMDNENDELTNDTVIKTMWVKDNDIAMFSLHGNGGVMDYYGNKISNITTRAELTHIVIQLMMNDHNFKRDGMYQIGFDGSATCNRYDEYGLLKEDYYQSFNASSMLDVYVCWNAKPDGIYVNDVVFVGNNDSCFDGYYNSGNYYSIPYILRFDGETISFAKDNSYYFNPFGPSKLLSTNILGDYIGESFMPAVGESGILPLDVHSFEIVENGKTLVSLTEADITKDNNDSYQITNSEKKALLIDYASQIMDACSYSDTEG